MIHSAASSGGPSRWTVAPITALLMLAFADAVIAAGHVLLYCSLDTTANADFAVGNPHAECRQGDQLLPLTTGGRGRWGEALDAGTSRRGSSLRYEVQANLLLDTGTIELFAKLPEPSEPRSTHAFFTVAGKRPFRLTIGPRSNGEGLVLGFSWNGESVWVYRAEPFVASGKWQHYAVTWDMTGGPGQGTVSVFVDGQRRLQRTDLDPYQWSLEHIYVGSHRILLGSIDDLAVFDHVRYVEDFTPRQAPLKKGLTTEEAQAARTMETHNPPLGSQSLFNGEFDQWSEGKPVGWEIHRGSVVAEPTTKMSGLASLQIDGEKQGDLPPYAYCAISSMPVVLQPNSRYRLSAWMMRWSSAYDIRFTVNASDGSTVGQYNSGWTSTHPWFLIATDFQTTDVRQYYVDIWSRQDPGHTMWLDELVIEKVGGSLADASPADEGRGFQLFSRSIMESFELPRRPPSANELVDSLVIRMARGEFEPGLLGLFGLQELQGVDLRLAGPLQAADGEKISEQQVTVRRLEGALLPDSRPRAVRSGQSIAWWVTVKTAKTTAAGTYSGMLQITSSEEVLAEVPLTVEVMDFVLPEPEIAFLMYHHETYFEPHLITPQLQQLYYQDMFDHGMNSVTVYNNADVDGEQIDFDHNYVYEPDEAMFGVGLDTQMKWILDSGLCATGQPVLWLTSGHGYGWGGIPEPALRATLDAWQSRDWPTPLLYVNDEPGGEGPRAEAARKRLKTIKSWNVPIETTTAGIDPQVLGQYYDVWIQGQSGVTGRTLSLAEDLQSQVWTYNSSVPHENMPFSRAFYGFWAYHAGVKGVAQWAYYDLKRWYANEEGQPQGDPFTRLSRVCPSPQGPISTLSWEATREGVDDYRYAMLMQQLRDQGSKLFEEFTAAAQERLSEQDRAQIDEREHRRLRHQDLGANAWRPSNEEEAEGERFYLDAKDVERALYLARRAKELTIESIPVDTMVTRDGAGTHSGALARWCPPLGPVGLEQNPVTITDYKRRVLSSYIASLAMTLRHYSTADK